MPRIYNRFELNGRRRELRNDATEPEKNLWSRLKLRQVDGKRFRRQFSIGSYVVDFYCPELHLIIEVDGDSHFTPEGLEYDKERTAYLEGIGLRVLRFTNEEVRDNINGVLERIVEFIDALSPPYQRGA